MYKLSFEVINVIFFPKWLHAFFKLVLQTICWLYKVKKKQTNKQINQLLWNSQNREHQKYLGNVIVLREIS